MSVLNPNITHVAIDGALFQDEVDARQVMAVPSVFLNGEPFDQGRMTLEQIVGKLDAGGAERTAAAIDAKDPFDVLVVGGGPAGGVGRRLRRPQGHPHRRAVRAVRRPGARHHGHRELHLGPLHRGPAGSPPLLEQHVKEYEVDVMDLQRAARLVPRRRAGGLVTVELESGATVAGPIGGAEHRRPLAPDRRARRGRVPQQGRHLLPALRRPAVQGQARRRHRRRQLGRRGRHRPGRRRRPRHPDRVRRRGCGPTRSCSASCAACPTSTWSSAPHHRDARRRRELTGLTYDDRTTGEAHEIAIDGVFVQIGLLPNTEWLDGTVELSPAGEVVVDERATRRSRASSPPATAPPCRSSRSSSPWAPGRPPR